MTGKYKKLLIITLLFNIIIFTYYLANSDINPSMDAFYYLALADSFCQGTGFANITTDPPKPIYTPQNGIVFIHILLQSLGLHNAQARLLVVKLINYGGFLLLIAIFYNIFKQLKVSSEITCLSIGILLSGAHFVKTIIQPLNEGFWCVLTAIVFYLAISNENKWSFVKIVIIAFLGIALANFRLNGPIIILSIAVTYLLMKKFEKSLIFFAIVIFSYASVYIILSMLKTKFVGFNAFGPVYTYNFIISRPMLTLIYTLPGVLMGITGKWWPLYNQPPSEYLRLIGGWIIVLPFSLLLCYYYVSYFLKEMKGNNFIKLLTICYIILILLGLQGMPGSDSRYIITILPFTLIVIATTFKDCNKLRLFLGTFLVCTILISAFRMIAWDSIFFNNNQSSINIKNEMREPYTLISEEGRYSYFIFGKRSNSLESLDKEPKIIVIFGRDKFNDKTLNSLRKKVKISRIEYLSEKIIVAHGPEEIYHTVKIIAD
jgi:hypothetical protein